MRVMRVLSDATNVIAEGEVLQLMNCHDADRTRWRLPAGYPLQDGQALRGGGAAGAIIGVRRARWKRRLPTTACTFRGTAFQLVDDVPRLFRPEADTGKHLGDDLAEGKPTLPLIYVMQHGTPEQSACVRRWAIENGGARISRGACAIRATGAIGTRTTCGLGKRLEFARGAPECVGIQIIASSANN